VQNANAQLELTLGAGMNAPLGMYGDQTNTGLALNAGLGYRVVPLVVVGMETSYNRNSGSDELLAPLGPDYEMTTSIFQYAAMAKFVFPVGQHSVFAKGSMGNYRGSATVTGPLGEASVNNTDLGYGLGGGFLINTAKGSSFFADFTHHSVAYDGDSEDTTFFAITVGALIRFDFFKSSLNDKTKKEIEKLHS